jgi:hypothetical protein
LIGELSFTTAVAASPAINQRLPIAWLVPQTRLEMERDISGNESCTDFLGIKRAALFIKRTDGDAFGIPQYRTIDGARNMVQCKF